jgi:HD-like signal output (HDOD) protein
MKNAPNMTADEKDLAALRLAVRKRLSSETFKVPMMPQVAGKVMALTNNPDADLSDLSGLIHRYPALAARVLQAANSAAYGGGQEVISLDEAVNRLGLKILGEVILAASLRAGLFRVAGFEEEVNRLWRHTLFSAYFGKEIARLRSGAAEALFLCGLLHGIGKPTVLQLIAELAKQQRLVLKLESIEALLTEFQSEVSISVVRQWSLPQLVQVTCANYENYSRAPASKEEAAIIYLADLLASWAACPGKVDEPALQRDAVFGFLQFDSDGIQSILGLREAVESQVAALEK